MRPDAARLFASPAALLTGLLHAGRSPSDLNWRLGTASEPGRWFIVAESDLEREVVVDPRGWPDGADFLSELWAAAEAEWAAGAPLPEVWLREEWKLWRGPDELFDAAAVQRLVPLLPALRRRPPSARDLGQLFALLVQHPVDGLGLPMDVPVVPPDENVLGETAPLANAHLRLRVPDVEPETVSRMVATGWVEDGTGPLRALGRAGQIVLDLLPHHWLRVEVELIPPDHRPVLGHAILGEAILATEPSWSRL